jgi:pyridoxamine 5'-phosphate oxidase
MKIANIRKEYSLKSLDISDVSIDPLRQFKVWFDEAVDSEALEVNAMCLSTIGIDGYPNGRIVLLKEIDHGFVFFTNYDSQKGQELMQQPKACLTFFWAELERQVRIIGDLEKVSKEESDQYFYSRPFGSQIGAWASPQSQKIESREILIENINQLEKSHTPETITRPSHWGGFRVLPHRVEFWQGRPNRLHDRINYEKSETGSWMITRLAP